MHIYDYSIVFDTSSYVPVSIGKVAIENWASIKFYNKLTHELPAIVKEKPYFSDFVHFILYQMIFHPHCNIAVRLILSI